MGEKKRPRVAIDGPAGAGKSTVARLVAQRLGFVLLDTGALYRAVALAAQREGADWNDEPTVGEIARRLVEDHAISVKSTVGQRRGESEPPPTDRSATTVLLRGEDVSRAIRAPDMSMGASRVSAIPAVREALLDMQRQAGREGGVVLEGRDIGTVVFPDAEVKFFLTASPEVRATRRRDELEQAGREASYEQTLDEVIRRDKADTERAIAPLRRADDAILIDSSGEPIDLVVDRIVGIVDDWMNASGGS